MPVINLQGGALDGLALHYLEAGRGPTVVLVHGLGGFAASWRQTIEGLADRATLLAPDLPGFGRSAKPRTRYGLDFFAASLHGFLTGLGVGRVTLVGHSLGAAIALTYAMAHPARVDRIALLSGLVPGFTCRLAAVYRVLAIAGIGEALALCGCAPIYRAALARCFYRPRAEDVEFLVQCDYAARTGWDARMAYLATVRAVREDVQQRGELFRRGLAGLDVPMLLIHGRQDPVVPAGHCHEVTAGLARAETRWVDECGHFPQIEHADMVNAWLADFLAARPAPR